MTPKVSVVVPVDKNGPYLKKCLDSLINQTLTNIEIICVNDHETDKSLEIIKEFQKKDPRIKSIIQKNRGLAMARNAGMDIACGDYLICVDGDDFFEDNMLEYLYYQVKSDQSDVIVCGFYLYDNNTESDIQITYPQIPANTYSPITPEKLKENLFTIFSPTAWTKLWRTSYIRENKFYYDDIPFAEDVYFSCLGLACAKKISFTNIPFIHYRYFMKDQKTCKNPNLDSLLKTLTKLYQSLKQRNLLATYGSAFSERLISSARWELGNLFPKKPPLLQIRDFSSSEIFPILFPPKSGPAVSIILAVYNMEKYLPKCLDSLINQTLKNIEIICVDDGSTDGSLKLLQEYANKDNRIKVLTQKNQKLPLARRHAMKIATGEYIQYVDADDYIELDTCECLYLYSKLYELDMCFFAGENFSDNYKKVNDAPLQLTWLPDHFTSVFSYKNLSEIIHRLNVGSCLTFYRHDFLKENHIEWINEALAYEDTPFFIESLFSAKRIGALKENFYHRRKHVGCITEQLNSNFPDYCQVVLKALAVAKRLADEITLSNYFKGITLNAFVVYKKGCSKEAQQKFKQIMYDFFQKAEEIIGIRPLKEVRNWCKVYEKRKSQL